LNRRSITTIDFKDSAIHKLREDFHLLACFSRNSLWNTCGNSARKAYFQYQDLNTHRVHNLAGHLSRDRKCIPFNKHGTSSKFSTFPQGLLRLRVLRVLFTSFCNSSFAVVFNFISGCVIWRMLPLEVLFCVFDKSFDCCGNKCKLVLPRDSSAVVARGEVKLFERRLQDVGS